MGVDLTLRLVRDNKVVADDIFSGRNGEWFDNIANNGNESEIYENFPVTWGWPEGIADKDKFDEWCYDFRTLDVKEFLEWFKKSRPDIDAGWVTKREAWLYKEKGIAPEYLHRTKALCVANNAVTMDDDTEYMCEDDAEFIVVVDKHDRSAWLYRWCKENAKEGDVLIYCFDC